MKITLIISFLIITFFSHSQPGKKNIQSFFGIQIKPILPAKYIGQKNYTFSTNNSDSIQYSSSINQKTGYSFGGTVRAGISKLIAIETGINFYQRNFNLNVDVPDSNIFVQNDISFINYGIPINVIFYIPLSKNIYMNASLGASLTMKPTRVGVTTKSMGSNEFYHTGIVNNKFGIALNGNVGFEYRIKKIGIFYIGGSAQIPIDPIFNLQTLYKHEGYRSYLYGDVNGSYFAIDLKYFLPIINNKGKQFLEGPIE